MHPQQSTHSEEVAISWVAKMYSAAPDVSFFLGVWMAKHTSTFKARGMPCMVPFQGIKTTLTSWTHQGRWTRCCRWNSPFRFRLKRARRNKRTMLVASSLMGRSPEGSSTCQAFSVAKLEATRLQNN